MSPTSHLTAPPRASQCRVLPGGVEAPNVILYVTQNWNPGGSGGTYNDDPIGV